MENELINSRVSEKYTKAATNIGQVEYGSQAGCGMLTVEKNAFILMELLDKYTYDRTRDCIQFDLKVEGGTDITILVTSEKYEFRIESTEWTLGYAGPVKTSKYWKTFKIGSRDMDEIKKSLGETISLAIKKSKSEMVTCRYCKRKFSKDHIIMKNVCHSCASAHLDVVF